MTFFELINVTSAQLKGAKIETAQTDAMLLIQSVFSLTRIQLLTKLQEFIPNNNALTQLNAFIDRRCRGEPLALILETTSFFGYLFRIKSGILVPRSETELLVIKIIDFCKTNNISAPNLLELGYGCGCILLSLACYFPKLTGYGWDISKEAYLTAIKNQEQLICSNVKFYHNDFFSDPNLMDLVQRPNTIFVSNPPYVPTASLATLDRSVIHYEPLTALDGGLDGLKFYKKCFELFRNLSITQFYEVGVCQKDDLTNLIDQYDFKKFNFFNDYHLIPRVLQIQ